MIKRSLIITAVILSVTIFSGNSYSSSSLKWYNFNEGIKLAKKTKKPIVIDFFASWCGWCIRMDKTTFSDQEVVNELKKNYITIRINTESKDEIIHYKNDKLSIQDFSMMMGVRGLPTLVFMDPSANPVMFFPGYASKETFMPIIKNLKGYIRSNCYAKKVSFNDYLRDKSICSKK